MKWNKLERKLSWQILWKYEPLQLSFFVSDSCTTLLPFSTMLTQWTLSEDPTCLWTNIMSYNVILVALSQYRHRWLHNRVLERDKDQRTKLSRSSSALLDFEVSRYTLPGHRPPSTSQITGHPLYLSPAAPHFLYVCFEVEPPGILRSSSLPLSLWIPGKDSSGNDGCRFPECVPNTTPSSLFYFEFNGPLLCSLSKFCIAYGFWPMYLGYSSEAVVYEGLDLSCGFLCCPSCFWPIQWDRIYVGVEDPELSFGSYCPGAPLFLSWRKATLALPIRALTSESVPPRLFTMLPRYVKFSTSSSTFSPSTIGPSLAVLWEKKIQKQTPQQIPACRTNPRTCRRG